jgi:hypothetical protein
MDQKIKINEQNKTVLNESQNKISQKGKTVDEVLPFLLSGESDDLPEDLSDNPDKTN